jgi:hypothetical protein
MASVAVLAMLHGAALTILEMTEVGWVAKAAFLLAWGALNFAWLAVLRRPILAAFLSLEIVVALVMLSRFKHDKLWMTLDFVDILIIDQDTAQFLLAALPNLRMPLALAVVGTLAALGLGWRYDPYRLARRGNAAGALICLGALVGLALWQPTNLDEDFLGRNYVSKFFRTGVEAIHERFAHGYLDAAPDQAEHLAAPVACHPARKLPHIILLHDESSFDITAAPGINVPAGYRQHFVSFDGKARKFIVEGAGGPSWFTEYNVLTGLSVRSFGRFATSVTRMAAGHVLRGLPHSLHRCGYTSVSLYPFYGSFLGSRAFQTSTGIDRYLDMTDLGTRNFEADSYYFDQATQIIEKQRNKGPLFLYVYTVANLFPWDTRFRPDLTPDWKGLSNATDVDEYIRRQGLSATDYKQFLQRLASEFPDESFVIVRYGDHQPGFSPRILDRTLDEQAVARRLKTFDPTYFTTYYAIDAVNFTPVDVSAALDPLDAPYLPLVILEAAGVPLDPTFAEQRKILSRCAGRFYGCAHGAEVRRFNRLLIQAGMIRGL